jgi:hypothetical protein
MMSDAPVLALPFLGQRTYLHGTTLFETLIEPAASDLSFKINRLIPSNRVRIHETAPEGAKISAQLVFTGADGVRRTRLVTAEPPSEQIDRAPFDEKAVTDLAEFDGERATLAVPSPVTPIKTLVALNKALLLRRFPPAKPGQWFFTRIDGDFYPAAPGHVVLTCRATLSPHAMASDVTIDDRPLGRLIFSWAEAS